MATPPASGPTAPRPKPWERTAASSGQLPFNPPSSGTTSNVVESSGTAKPGEVVPAVQRSSPATVNTIGRPLPPRPWQQNYGSSYGGIGSNMYSSFGGYGGSYGGGPYGTNSMYSSYGGLYGGSGMYGGGLYNNSLGGPYGGYGMMTPFGNNQDPNNPHGQPPSPPGFWMSFLRVMHGVVNFFGRVAVLVDQNTQAFHMFMTALLQLFDRSGLLYGELARFVLRILGFRTRQRKGMNGPGNIPAFDDQSQQQFIEAPKSSVVNSWDNVWGGN